MKRIIAFAVGLLTASTSVNAAECSNAALKRISEKGEISVGVKADYKPFGFRDTNGDVVGLEIDLAKEVASSLGVKLRLVPVVASNRMQFVEQGQTDLMIATMTDTKERRNIVGIPGPNYYASGTNILAPKALAFKDWKDLNGKPVCGIQGAFYNQSVSDKYGAKISAFTNAAEAKQALRDRKCVAFLFDDSSIASDLASGQWDDFEMPLKSEDQTPWGIAVAKEEESCAFGNLISGLEYNWHRNGLLLDLQKKWGIKSTGYLEAMHEKLADPIK
ncbi:transporter substrate-binding domain-containing protein [Neorhizobium sp. NCHU2750]|uniref:transporter substrate-binding domain-containing protein n=1 Tax=Neorhizobium sp. NCHU2750 TaxID=1825976 RepID=UPI000E74590F|nr:amino acid ABC transporter substrate-binding protein [Neorhizobium sp. NCHU2750]